MKKVFLFLFVLTLFSTIVLAQTRPAPSSDLIIDPNPIFVSSAQCGSQSSGCMAASMASMLASLHDSRIGTNVTKIIEGLNADFRRQGGDYPYPTYRVITAAIHFLAPIIL